MNISSEQLNMTPLHKHKEIGYKSRIIFIENCSCDILNAGYFDAQTILSY